MSTTFRKFASISHPAEFGYLFDSGQWLTNNTRAIEPTFRMFQTLGDGMTQHSGDWPVTGEYLADFLVSLAVVLLEDRELASAVEYRLNQRPNMEDVKFAASIKWKETDDDYGKRRWYSRQERKITTSASKEHDKRYERVQKPDDGSASAVYRMLSREYMSGLERYLLADTIRDFALSLPGNYSPYFYMPFPPEFLKWEGFDHEQSRDLRHAIEAATTACHYHRSREIVETHVENAKRRLERRTAQAETAPAAEESTAA